MSAAFDTAVIILTDVGEIIDHWSDSNNQIQAFVVWKSQGGMAAQKVAVLAQAFWSNENHNIIMAYLKLKKIAKECFIHIKGWRMVKCLTVLREDWENTVELNEHVFYSSAPEMTESEYNRKLKLDDLNNPKYVDHVRGLNKRIRELKAADLWDEDDWDVQWIAAAPRPAWHSEINDGDSDEDESE
jgi:hypothetical protein